LVEWRMDRIGFIFLRLMISPARGRLYKIIGISFSAKISFGISK